MASPIRGREVHKVALCSWTTSRPILMHASARLLEMSWAGVAVFNRRRWYFVTKAADTPSQARTGP